MSRYALLLVLVVACRGGEMVAAGTPQDLENLVVETMASIRAAVPARAGCLRDVTVTHAWELEDRAEYRAETRTIVLRVPATTPELEFSLAHEIGHHLELTCNGHTEFRPAFLDALGHEATQPWFDGDSWETTPSVQFATALASLVTGGPDPLRRVEVSDQAMQLVEMWAQNPPSP